MAHTATKLNDASAKTEKELERELTKLIGSEGFARVMAETMSTSMGLIKLGNEAFEHTLRAMRLPTQGELTRISRQIVRLEDKLEDLLVAIERIELRLDERDAERSNGKARA